MKTEVLVCPFCGAPHRETIEIGTVQLACRYCGGTMLVPPDLGGGGQRCPNHPEVLSVGLCNDCSGSYCSGCLRFYEVEHGVLHLCPKCFRNRHSGGAQGSILAGLLMLAFGFFVIATQPTPEAVLTVGVLYVSFLVFPFIAYGVYRIYHPPEGVSLKDRNNALRREVESRKALGEQTSTYEVYNSMLHYNTKTYGPQLGMRMLKTEIDYYVKSGMTRSEAVRKVAEDKGY